MSNLFKDIYSEEFYNEFSTTLSETISPFNKADFIRRIFTAEFDSYELKKRMTHTAKVLHHFLPDKFEEAATILIDIIKNLRKAGIKEQSIEFMFLPEYISMFGIDDYKNSIATFEIITQFTSCEFAVRPYIVKYEVKMMKQMLIWSKHNSYLVRRLASEGSRPRLPWAMALPSLKNNPEPILPILESLKKDSSETVRRSVANNLNDISKDNPQFVISTAKEWQGISKETDAIIKHACRTMLKQGNTEILKLFGFDSKNIILSNFKINTPTVNIGGKLDFSFSLVNNANKSQLVRIEYGVYYKKNNGTLARKVFKISERKLSANEKINIKRKQSFKIITTRRLYCGIHKLSIIINGQESSLKEFNLQ